MGLHHSRDSGSGTRDPMPPIENLSLRIPDPGSRIPGPGTACYHPPREVRMTRLISPRVLLALGVVAALGGAMVQAQRTSSSAAMATAAEKFLASLTPEQRQQATFQFDSAERLRWHFVPQFERNGLQLKAMTEPQRKLAQELLRTGLSDRGYTTYTQIMQLENILKATEKGSGPGRDPEGYRFSVFGTPSAKGTWGWRVEFHHVSLHFDIVNGTAISSTPVVCRGQSCRSQGRSAEGTAYAGAARGHGAYAGHRARCGAAQDGDLHRRRTERHRHGERTRHQPVVTSRAEGIGDDPRAARPVDEDPRRLCRVDGG